MYWPGANSILSLCIERLKSHSEPDVACLLRRLNVDDSAALKLLAIVSLLKLSLRFEAAAVESNVVFIYGRPCLRLSQVRPYVLAGLLPNALCAASEAFSRLLE